MRACTGLAMLAAAFAVQPAGAKPSAVAILFNNLPPRASFARTPQPPAPDYRDDTSWIALPGRADASDIAPRGSSVVDEANVLADVFWVYPTVFMGGQRWNADVRDAALNTRIDASPMREQASVFTGCCRIYAPRYRQMVLGGYLRWSKSSEAATELAYGDVARAFDEFLRRQNGRPFIVAGHSQGSRLLRLLIERRIDGTPLARRMVAAYLPGHWIEAAWFDRLRTMTPCRSATDTGCVLTWSSYADGNDASAQRRRLGRNTFYRPEATGRDYVCINPLNWRADATPAPARANRGGWVHGPGARPAAPVPGVVAARCGDGALYVSPPTAPAFTKQLLPNGNFHNYDYNLVYMNVRANAAARVAAWQSQIR